MKKIVLVAYIATLFCVQDAIAGLLVEKSDTCSFEFIGNSHTGSVVRVVANCASPRYYQLKNRQTGDTYGVYGDCAGCDSGYYSSETGSYSVYHNTCGKVNSTTECLAKKTCSSSTSAVSSSNITGCASAVKMTFGGTTVYSCNTCNSGYTKTSETVSDRTCTNTTTRYYCSAPACTAVTVSTYSTPTMTGCKTQYKKSFGGQEYDTCGECKTGYYLAIADATTISSTQCNNTAQSISCISNCTNSTGWTCFPSPSKVCVWRVRAVQGNRCVGQNYYTCTEGYYGKADVSGKGCEKCPENPGGSTPRVLWSYTSNPVAMKSYKGNPIDDTTIEDCFVTSGKDASGEYEFVNGSTSKPCGYTFSN